MNAAPSRVLTRRRDVLLVVLLGMTALAWVLVVRGPGSGGETMPGGLGLTMGMSAPVFLAMWVAMMVGMMFPASAPMILTFSTLQARKREAGRPYVPVSVFVGAYMAVWTAFGLLAFGLAAGADRVAERWGWVTVQWPRIAGGLLVAAGLYQLSPLKDVCLGKCRTPFSFLLAHWRDGPSGAFRMGLWHGLYCLGCCWLLFVVLVPLGVMNLAAMAAITVVVFAEKTLPAGRGLARAAAGGLVAYGALVVAVPAALPGML